PNSPPSLQWRNRASHTTARVPTTRLERLATLRRVRYIDSKIQSADTTPEERQKLFSFSAFLAGAENQINLFGKQLPSLLFQLVTLEDGSSPQPVKSICIVGLKTDSDIKLFHKAMSQQRYRHHYHPWKLCYEAEEIRKLSGTEDGQYQIQRMVERGTYCGALLRTNESLDTWLSTIGGIVTANDQLFLMTTAHRPKKDQAPSVLPNSSPTSTLREDDFSHDIEPALILYHDNENPARTSKPT
ncbi:hypothetical protein QBC38DRAFT_333185, partial [Podospora fimiseda]